MAYYQGNCIPAEYFCSSLIAHHHHHCHLRLRPHKKEANKIPTTNFWSVALHPPNVLFPKLVS